jgi:hypothetical protein
MVETRQKIQNANNWHQMAVHLPQKVFDADIGGATVLWFQEGRLTNQGIVSRWRLGQTYRGAV